MRRESASSASPKSSAKPEYPQHFTSGATKSVFVLLDSLSISGGDHGYHGAATGLRTF